MSPPDQDVVALFAALESNRQRDVADARARFADLLNAVKDAWLVLGCVNYYLSTGSVRIVEVLAKAPAPHDRHLCERLGDGLRAPWRNAALALLGHVVRRQPLWLHRLVALGVLRDLLNLLRTERDVVPLVNGLLVLITLLPMVPTLIGPHLPDAFAVFARLAAWDAGDAPLDGDKEHLRLALYGLFQHLYGMFPCNFVEFLKREYARRENADVFTHTVRPMVEAVRMHPLLITATKTAETDAARWKKMEHHDVLVECRRFSSESARERRDDDGGFRARCGTDAAARLRPEPRRKRAASASTPDLSAPQPPQPPQQSQQSQQPPPFSPLSLADRCGLRAPSTPPPDAGAPPPPSPPPPRLGGSPPEAAVEATPENTPAKDVERRFEFAPESPAVRALGARLAHAPRATSQPPSPLKKEPPPPPANRDAFYAHHKLGRVLQERAQQRENGSPRRRRADDDDDEPRAPPREDERSDDEEATCDGDGPRCEGRRHGLHMPASASIVDLVHRATRLRYHSQCVAESTSRSATRSAGPRSGRSTAARRARSCPELRADAPKRSPPRGSRDADAQTIEIWPLEYEHLLADVVRNARDEDARAPPVDDGFDPFAPYAQVDRYVEALARGAVAPSTADDVDRLRRQLELLHVELLYERHRREVHAFRNRRLLGRSRKNRATEEQNVALKRELDALRDEKDELERQLGEQKRRSRAVERERRDELEHWRREASLRDAELERERREREKLAALLLEQRADATDSSADLQRLRAALFDLEQQLQRANRKSELGERHVECIKRMQRELIVCGERDARYREALAALPSKAAALYGRHGQQCKEHLLNAQALLQTHSSKIEYLQARETELDALVDAKDTAVQELKRQLRLVKEEYGEKLRSVEDKYQSVKRINQRMEAHCLELLQRVPQSPQTISRDLTSGFSPQSSPLSASLASSEGHGPLLAPRVDEIRNLQVIVNAHEIIEEATVNSVNSTTFEDDAH